MYAILPVASVGLVEISSWAGSMRPRRQYGFFDSVVMFVELGPGKCSLHRCNQANLWVAVNQITDSHRRKADSGQQIEFLCRNRERDRRESSQVKTGWLIGRITMRSFEQLNTC